MCCAAAAAFRLGPNSSPKAEDRRSGDTADGRCNAYNFEVCLLFRLGFKTYSVSEPPYGIYNCQPS